MANLGGRPRPHVRQFDRQSAYPAIAMRNLITLAILIALGSYGYSQYQRRLAGQIAEAPALSRPAPIETLFKCDGRIYCSQMTSCAEATYFIQHCPNTKMDGNNDGEPCERQWCNKGRKV